MAETRRRGAALEQAILDAAWDELTERGYGGMTFEAVAERARTSKPVLYRRWPTKEALLLAVLAHRGVFRPTVPADTGSLRGDVVAALMSLNRSGSTIAGLFSTVLGSYFAETGNSIADLRTRAFGSGRSGMATIVQRAVDRGELPPEGLPARIVSLPVDLLRHELLLTLAPVAESVVLDVVDTVFMPLVRTTTDRPGRPTTDRPGGPTPDADTADDADGHHRAG